MEIPFRYFYMKIRTFKIGGKNKWKRPVFQLAVPEVREHLDQYGRIQKVVSESFRLKIGIRKILRLFPVRAVGHLTQDVVFLGLDACPVNIVQGLIGTTEMPLIIQFG